MVRVARVLKDKKSIFNMIHSINDSSIFFHCYSRFLATGESFRSLAFYFRVGVATILKLIVDKSNAICE
mgnify:CR=1 FL=1